MATSQANIDTGASSLTAWPVNAKKTIDLSIIRLNIQEFIFAMVLRVIRPLKSPFKAH